MQILSDSLLQYTYNHNSFIYCIACVLIFPELHPVLPVTSLYCYSFERS